MRYLLTSCDRRKVLLLNKRSNVRSELCRTSDRFYPHYGTKHLTCSLVKAVITSLSTVWTEIYYLLVSQKRPTARVENLPPSSGLALFGLCPTPVVIDGWPKYYRLANNIGPQAD